MRDHTAYRLPSEAEHHATRDSHLVDRRHDMVMHDDCLSQGYNLNLATGGENPVHTLPANDKGFHDSFGNVWQWCEDYFHPLIGSKSHPYYDDFSTPCYDGEHRMMLGGSFISTGDEASIWARFQFRLHFHQHAGFPDHFDMIRQAMAKPIVERADRPWTENIGDRNGRKIS